MELDKVKNYKGWGAVLVIILLLLIDQVVKIWVKTHMYLGEEIYVTSWFRILFTENPGMAFGLEIFNKMFLTIFRIIAAGAIAWYMYIAVRQNVKFGYLVCVALIFTGASGNIIDCVFYGVYFGSSYGQVASFLPDGGGYASWLHGRVVDMLYFPLIDTTWPDWVPIWGGKDFVFFRPIFNIADSCICIGVFIVLLFYRKTLSYSLEHLSKKKDTPKHVE